MVVSNFLIISRCYLVVECSFTLTYSLFFNNWYGCSMSWSFLLFSSCRSCRVSTYVTDRMQARVDPLIYQPLFLWWLSYCALSAGPEHLCPLKSAGSWANMA